MCSLLHLFSVSNNLKPDCASAGGFKFLVRVRTRSPPQGSVPWLVARCSPGTGTQAGTPLVEEAASPSQAHAVVAPITGSHTNTTLFPLSRSR